MDKKYAIFDMDGTLIDSMPFWQNLAPEYLRGKGVTGIPADLTERIKTMTMPESAAMFTEEFGLSGDPEAEMNAIMEVHYQNDIPLKPGVRRYLQSLRAKGVRLCVASATAEHLMEACLSRLGIRGYFEFLLSCETVGAGKDSSLVYQVSAERLGAKPDETAVYEDALYAVRTAKEAGFYVVGVHDHAEGNWKTIEKTADEIIGNWEEAI